MDWAGKEKRGLGQIHVRWALVGAALALLSLVFDNAAVAEGDASPNVVDSTASKTEWSEVQDILNRRCVVCHSCYDAPCQLKLTSPAGLLRGGSKDAVYHSQRLKDAQPTRLGIDAQTIPEWRALGFHSIIPNAEATDSSVNLLERYLALGRENPLKPNAYVPEDLGLAVDRPLVCPSPQEFGDYRESHPLAGMPYATAPLDEEEYLLLDTWAKNGGPLLSSKPEIPDEIKSQIEFWEAFLNQRDLRTQLASRYIYEHLFLARLHFPDGPPRQFFQLVRSSTPPGEPIQVIATRRPFDAPGNASFYYRLRPISETIVHKEHLVYSFAPARLDRFKELFLEPDWDVSVLPAYGDAEGGDPFSTFADIPARSRYQFLLDDALFFVRSFIRGPVCHGQTAVDVIEDRFWVSFLDPEADLSITDPAFLTEGSTFLELPVTKVEDGATGDLQSFSHKNQVNYLKFRDAKYRASPAHKTGFDYTAIWDGDGHNPNALITVFRHFDNASAMTGFHGDIPETAWVIDYPVFERIYYNLVAGYDVFGRIEHQLSTRLYMDELRMESEDTFLSFMPQDIRQDMHSEWYKGALAAIHTYWHERHVDSSFPSGVAFETSDPKREFLLKLLDRGNGLWSVTDPINRCEDAGCVAADQSDTASALRELASQSGNWVQFLPDVSVLLIEHESGDAELFSLVHDKAHDNVAFLFDESARRAPQSDVLTVMPGIISSYPNFFFKVTEGDIGPFVQSLMSMKTQSDWLDVIRDYGVRRTSPDFWETGDRIHTMFARQNPVQAGILDINRYKDPKPGDDPT